MIVLKTNDLKACMLVDKKSIKHYLLVETLWTIIAITFIAHVNFITITS